jgi:hypothetical protein
MRFRSAPVFIDTSGDNVVVAAVPGRAILVYKLLFVTRAPIVVTMKSGSTVLGGPYIFTARGSSMSMYYDGSPHWETAIGEDFVLNLDDAVTLTGQVHYTLV